MSQKTDKKGRIFVRAAIVDQVRSLKIVEREIPAAKSGYVLVKVEYTSICGSDLGYWNGKLMLGKALGHEFSGVVYDPGDSEFAVGEKVCGIELNPCGSCIQCRTGRPNICPHVMEDSIGITRDGSYAEYVSLRSDMLRRVPKGVSMVEASLAEPVSVSYHAVNRAGIGAGDRVLIMGGGPIGAFAAACSKVKGAKYVGVVEIDPDRVAILQKLPFVDQVFWAGEEDYLKQIRAVAPDRFPTVIDCIGKESTVRTAINLVCSGGKLVEVGLQEVFHKIPANKLVLKEISIITSAFFLPEEFDEVLKMMAEKKLDVTLLVTDIRPLEQAQESFEQLENGPNKGMKILLKP